MYTNEKINMGEKDEDEGDTDRKDETHEDENQEDGAEEKEEIEETTEELPRQASVRQVYKDIHAQLEDMEGMENFDREYTRLFQEYCKITSYAETLDEENYMMVEKIKDYEIKLEKAIEINNANREIISRYKNDIEYARKMMDASHFREMNSQEVMEAQTKEISQLHNKIERLSRLIYQTDDFDSAKQEKEELLKEKENLNREITMMKQRIENVNTMKESFENDILDLKRQLEDKIDELKRLRQEMKDKTKQYNDSSKKLETEYAKCKSERVSAEEKIKELQAVLIDKQTTEEKLNFCIDQNEHYKNEFFNASLEIAKTNKELESKMRDIEKLTRDNANKTKDLAQKRDELSKLRLEFSREGIKREKISRKLETAEAQKISAQRDAERFKSIITELQKNLETVKKQADEDKTEICDLQKEKLILSRNILQAAATAHEQSKQLKLRDQIKNNLQIEIDNFTIESQKQKKEISSLSRERDRCILETKELTQKINELLHETKQKKNTIIDLKKKLTEVDTKYQMQQNLCQTLEGERNSLNKLLLEAQYNISDLKKEIKGLNHQTEELKEGIAAKERQLMKKQSILKKTEKEREHMRVELQKTRDELESSRQEIFSLNIDMRKLEKIIREADTLSKKQMLENEHLTNEQTILGTQLANKTDKLSNLYEKERLLQDALLKGETQYNQRLEDVRLLKLEIKKLRHERNLLTKNIYGTTDMRQQNFHLERDLTREKLKCRALEEQLQSPLNIHRWRKFEGTDPEKFELLQKIQYLEKRVLVETKKSVDKESKLREIENTCNNLRELLSRQPGPEAAERLQKTQRVLKERDEKIKCLIVELQMNETQVTKFISDIGKTKEELLDFKKKYYDLKLLIDKAKIHEQELSKNFNLPPIAATTTTNNNTSFLGGGYNITRK
ncbi:hypothetical protein L9F63_007295 [Diploptera punctata]|uniref:Cilia- and flagella-associated protein 58 central coiled coil domain-containing protein n=1 Tax=Diploptera punctata TaxID=6984 RepID=A0AAD7Z921_DIPPU|nr:hypothetical protein L9F63_007295 [Diploptera punctata]